MPASDAIGTARSTLAAVRAAVAGRGSPDRRGRRTHRAAPGSADERTGCDAAAVLIGTPTPQRPAIADVLATVSLTEEFLDRWRLAHRSVGVELGGAVRVQSTPHSSGRRPPPHSTTRARRRPIVVLTSPNSAVAKRASTRSRRPLHGWIAGGSPAWRPAAGVWQQY